MFRWSMCLIFLMDDEEFDNWWWYKWVLILWWYAGFCCGLYLFFEIRFWILNYSWYLSLICFLYNVLWGKNDFFFVLFGWPIHLNSEMNMRKSAIGDLILWWCSKFCYDCICSLRLCGDSVGILISLDECSWWKDDRFGFVVWECRVDEFDVCGGGWQVPG